ncbi:hypothetical protein FHG87_007574, partial [Trinorchestia longiramus]
INLHFQSQSDVTSEVSEATLVLHAATAVPPYARRQYQQQYNFHKAVRNAGQL